MRKSLSDNELDRILHDMFGQARVAPPPGVMEQVRAHVGRPAGRWRRRMVRFGLLAGLVALPLCWQSADFPGMAEPYRAMPQTIAHTPPPAPVAPPPLGEVPERAALPASAPSRSAMAMQDVRKDVGLPLQAPRHAKALALPIRLFSSTKVDGIAPSAIWKLDYSKQNLSPSHSFYLGGHMKASLVGILNQNTYGVFGNQEPHEKVSHGFTYGFHAGKRIGNRIWTEVGANLLSKQGQRYQGTINGQATYRAVSLVYHQIPILLKYEHPVSLGGKQLRAYWEAGLQYGYLLIARVRINDVEKGSYKRFNRDEWSLLLGKSIDWPVGTHAMLNFGVLAGISNDINADGWQAKGRYKKSHNVTAGLRVSLRFF